MTLIEKKKTSVKEGATIFTDIPVEKAFSLIRALGKKPNSVQVEISTEVNADFDFVMSHGTTFDDRTPKLLINFDHGHFVIEAKNVSSCKIQTDGTSFARFFLTDRKLAVMTAIYCDYVDQDYRSLLTRQGLGL